MTIYVDNARIPYRHMKMCHMIADDLDELHRWARALGLRRRWFQSRGCFPHYDLCWSKRQQAVAMGAVPVTQRQLGLMTRGPLAHLRTGRRGRTANRQQQGVAHGPH